MAQQARKAANLSLDEGLVSQARELKINISRAAEDGIAKAIKAERERLWRIENAEAIAASNAYVEKHGLPFHKYRQF
ncbi:MULTISPECIES: type II toxin-antitoxin system CcdA family antitoxin [Rhizobium]|uniref:type II toxin-antitoxin system CcdA family antitoxin n=1 Tax=Rhizobium TaxID=379 RepID=UPI000BE92D65|nr:MULTISPECIES: type II toxin-antitoxin system CcdA family antitoxin [Rhizobium]MBY4588422.1 type II toxin-antitoxin system CcdA family antitoxin [Rhizobium redzepovicii]MBY4614620.1 type II toxin-antitoxin system CcdA family antitoxin [Rhizobium redzepovicii]MDF0660251.1 type II toxin-antitoxin system CcdA family antitoxin [Rhizobium sp. BC49]MDR9780163.1 type II toxin-antitoxin system CcdA family antitoxin [Rhizobium redzepovicii]PDS86818.1 post-segregation antitoxin CcdA [Rhizobium sp. L18